MLITKEIEGNYELNLELEGDLSNGIEIFFSANADFKKKVFLKINSEGFDVVREIDGKQKIWKGYRSSTVNKPDSKIRILKKGNFYRFWYNDLTGHIQGPMGQWDNIFEPWKAWVGFEGDTKPKKFTATTLPWIPLSEKPVIPTGEKGSFYEQQTIPGGIIEYKNKYYLYFMAAMQGDEEGASRRTVGVATSDNLIDWEVHPKPIIELGAGGFDYDNLYPGSALVLDDGKIAVVYAAQIFPEWIGFFLATSDDPFGPFKVNSEGPVYKHFTHAHEFDLIEANVPEGRYMLIYSGYTPNPPSGPAGDRGYIVFSDDLIHWREHPNNPAFNPETLDNWDGEHIRPRGINKIGETWYLWYEGCYPWRAPGSQHTGWWDMTGLARSKDLKNWEYYPRNPSLCSTGIENHFESKWVAWPRMWVKDDNCYIYYVAGGSGTAQIGMRTTTIKQLTDWNSESGETLDLLNEL